MVFVSAWQPFISCVWRFALVCSFVLREFLIWVIAGYRLYTGTVPAIHMEELITVSMGLLGLGGLCTFEKIIGHSRKARRLRCSRLRCFDPEKNLPTCAGELKLGIIKNRRGTNANEHG